MRLILINQASGYIDGDTADYLAGVDWDRTPQDAVQRLVHHLGDSEGASGVEYAVYRADVDGSDAVPTVWDGQSRDTIAAVVASCEFLGVYRRGLGIGDRVEGGEGEDHDTGRIVSVAGDIAHVAWDSHVTTPANVSSLRAL